jgi:hypothetical protein
MPSFGELQTAFQHEVGISQGISVRSDDDELELLQLFLKHLDAYHEEAFPTLILGSDPPLFLSAARTTTDEMDNNAKPTIATVRMESPAAGKFFCLRCKNRICGHTNQVHKIVQQDLGTPLEVFDEESAEAADDAEYEPAAFNFDYRTRKIMIVNPTADQQDLMTRRAAGGWTHVPQVLIADIPSTCTCSSPQGKCVCGYKCRDCGSPWLASTYPDAEVCTSFCLQLTISNVSISVYHLWHCECNQESRSQAHMFQYRLHRYAAVGWIW